MKTLRASFSYEPDGARLSHVAGAGQGPAYWEVKVVLNGNQWRRRFAAEPNARAWLTSIRPRRVTCLGFAAKAVNTPWNQNAIRLS